MAVILEARSLTKVFSGLTALNNVSVGVSEGEIFGLIGPNGSGKTTLFNIMSGFIRPTSGEVIWQGVDITRANPEKVAALGLVRTFQEARLWPGMTVMQNMIMAQVASGRDHVGQREMEETGLKMLQFTGVLDLKDRQAGDVTFGQARKLGIALALVAKPKLLMLDEPFGGLNPREIDELLDLLRTIHGQGVTLWVIDHKVPFLASICSRIMALNAGEVIMQGTPHEVQSNDKVIEVYLGKRFART